MTAREGWTDDELAAFGGVPEVEVSSRREDGSLRRYVTIWLVRVGPELYIRSAYGPDNSWYRRALSSGAGRIRARGLERDVTFEPPDPQVHSDVDAAYHVKYDRYGPALVDTVVGPEAAAVTLRLEPGRT
jgi:hypothetical protein